MGMERMVVCLDNLVGKRFWASKGGFRKGDNFGDETFTNVRRHNIRDRENFVMHQGKYSYKNKSKRSAARGSLAGIHTVKASKRNWRDAVIIVRYSSSLSWRTIELGSARELKIHHAVNPLAAD